MGGCVGSVSRSGVIIAMSSGLVATMALPAAAVTTTTNTGEVSAPQASAPAAPESGSSAFFAPAGTGLLALPDGLAVDDGTVAAPVTATLTFDHTAFVAVPVEVQDQQQNNGSQAHDGSGSTQTAQQAPAPTTRRAARAAASPSSTGSSSGSSSSGSSASSAVVTAPSSGLGAAAVAIASRYIGTPYRYGGAAPGGFDCSGLVQYVYAQLGKKLPRTAAEQAAAVRHVPRSQAVPGDLVLFPGGGHIAIYLGGNMMLDAPHTGSSVGIRQIYSANVSFGHVV
jgi:peptidoglycan DL-endopeptidase CwlO